MPLAANALMNLSLYERGNSSPVQAPWHMSSCDRAAAIVFFQSHDLRAQSVLPGNRQEKLFGLSDVRKIQDVGQIRRGRLFKDSISALK